MGKVKWLHMPRPRQDYQYPMQIWPVQDLELVSEPLARISLQVVPVVRQPDYLQGIIHGEGGGIGALANAVLPPAIHGATASYGWLDDLFSRNLAKVRGGNIARDIAGKDLELIKQLTAKAPNNITAAQAATPARNTLWSALGKLSKDLDSNYTTRLLDKQAARRLDVLEKVKPPLDASILARDIAANKNYPIAFDKAFKADQ